MTELTQEQIDAVEGMVSRRMENLNETREEASTFVANYLRQYAEDLQTSTCACCGEPL